MGEKVQNLFGKSFGSLKLSYSQEASPLATAGALRLALPLLDSETVLILNGDSFCQFQFDNFWAWHRDRGSEATLLLTHVSDTARYGRVHVDQDGHIISFQEKVDSGGPGWINAGVYLISRRLLETIPPAGSVSLEREIFPVWVNERLYGCQIGGAFLDIGTPESLALATDFFASTVPA
jgi:NDP-sugar pyrophosphorylase family protein